MKKKLLHFALLALIVTAGTAMLNVSDEAEQVSEANQIEWVSISFDTALASTFCESGSGGICGTSPYGQICQSTSDPAIAHAEALEKLVVVVVGHQGRSQLINKQIF